MRGKCSYSACRKGINNPPIRIDAWSVRFPNRQVGSIDSGRWPEQDAEEYCSVLCLSDAIREDMGVR